MSVEKNVTIAIEAAIAGGSVSILRDNAEIASWIGTAKVSRAEDLLQNIDILLSENGVLRTEIDLLAVSRGPGSFTGIRIGIATALGLRTGFGIEVSSESILESMVFDSDQEGAITAAVPVGRNAVCLQSFHISNGKPEIISEPRTVTEDGFALAACNDASTVFLVHQSLYKNVASMSNTSDCGLNMAYAVGRICRQNRNAVIEPIFISKSF